MKLAMFSTALVCFFFLRVNAQQEAYLDPHLPLEVRVLAAVKRKPLGSLNNVRAGLQGQERFC